jgi:chromosome segregation ATPase
MGRLVVPNLRASGVFKTGPLTATGMPELLARLEKLAGIVVGIEREVTDIHATARGIELGAMSALPALPAGIVDDGDEKTGALQAQAKKLKEENERLEGELASLRVFRDQTQEKIQRAVSTVVDLKLAPEAEGAVRAIVVDRDRLQEEKAAVETELARIKKEAAKRLGALKEELDKSRQEHDTVRLQKENLMRQLRSRDEAGQGQRPVTLEDITSSEVFRGMLANIKQTSRQEILILHDAIASIKAIDPHAYETVLEIVARAFKKANVENPLALLPRG